VAERSLQPTVLRVCGVGVAALMALYALEVSTHFGSGHVRQLSQDYLYNGLLFAGAAFCLWRAAAIRRERLAWAITGVVIACWTAADILWTILYADAAGAPYPSVADGLWLLWYPACFAALVLLMRSRIASLRASLWLDAVIGALCTMSLAFALALGPIADGATGSTAAVLTNLAYPVGDIMLLGVVVAIFGLLGWRPGRAWLVLGAGLA
jgi:diguanylate cyclase